MARAAIIRRSKDRITELEEELRVLRHEQGLIIAELVWNEMRAWEIRGLLEGNPDGEQTEELRKDYHKRCNLIRSIAQWERGADQSYRRLRERLKDLLSASGQILENSAIEPGLTCIARDAAEELGLHLDGGVDDC
jgi:hypothetical protein